MRTDKLLRLRKAVPNAIPCAESHDAFLRVIVPLFEPDQIVDQCLVKIRPTKLVQRLNGELEDIETNVDPDAEPPLVPRPVRRQGIYLADDEFGLLITDMMASTCSPPASIDPSLTFPVHGYDVIEFKPKWLAQSPSAPKNSVRCRQCAYVARQNAACKRKGEKLHKSFCPLDLVSDDYDNIFRVAEILLRPAKEKEVKLFADWIFATPLLRRLRDNQVMLDPVGPINANASDEKFRAAMTLRDVTVYLRYPSNVDDISDCSEARLGDLDIKSAEKGTTWREKERILIDEGWYEGKEAPADTQPLTCALSGPNRGFA